MKTELEIKDKILEYTSDIRFGYPPVDVFINAPLALIQTSLDAKVDVLKWVLEEVSDA